MKRFIAIALILGIVATVAFAATTTTYKGLTVIDGTPSGEGGLLIQNNFKYIADKLQVNASIVVASSDASDDLKARSLYVCDGDADEVEASAAAALAASSKTSVYFAGGTFYVKNDPIAQPEGVHFVGAGKWQTVIQLQTGHTLVAGEALVKLAAADYFDGGGIRGIKLIGDGGINGTTGRADGTATIHGIDSSAVTVKVQNYEIIDCAIWKCAHGWHNTVGERFMPVHGCDVWYNNVGFWVGEHPNFGINDLRYNDVAIDGTPFDMVCNGVKFVNNRVGIKRTPGYPQYCHFNECTFSNSADVGAEAGTACKFVACEFVATSGTYAIALRLRESKVLVSGCKFNAAIDDAGWTTGCIDIAHDANRGRNSQIVGCHFENRVAGAVVFSHPVDNKLENTTIANNSFVLEGPIFQSVGSTTTWWSNVTFSGNQIRLNGNLGAYYVLWIDGTNTTGNIFTDNCFVNPSSYTHGGAFYGTLEKSIWSNNRFSAGWGTVFGTLTTDTDTRIADNVGLVTFNRGTATVASGATYVDVTHGLAFTPTAANISVSPTNNLGNAAKFWISDIGASTFRINVNADPGATTATFAWQAKVF